MQVSGVSAYQGVISLISNPSFGKHNKAAAVDSASSPSTEVNISDRAKWLAQQSLPTDPYTGIPADAIAEAKQIVSKLNIQPGPNGIGISYTDPNFLGLPMLPENANLYDQLQQQRSKLNPNSGDPVQATAFSKLTSQMDALATNGWQKPMTQADASHEADVQQAITATINQLPQNHGNWDQAMSDAELMASIKNDSTQQLAKQQAQWKSQGLTMPPIPSQTNGSYWLSLANQAGISQDEFMNKIREASQSTSGYALQNVMTKFISDRYGALQQSSGIDTQTQKQTS